MSELSSEKIKIQKVCEKCHREIPYLKAFRGGQECRCPLCGKIVDYFKCILSGDLVPITFISGSEMPVKMQKKKEDMQLSLAL